MHCTRVHAAVGGFTVAALGLTAVATPPTVIYSEIAGDDTSLVPDGAGIAGNARFDSFDRPYRSPDGLGWIISASTDLATGEDEIIIVGSGTTGTTVVREGTGFGVPTGVGNVGPIDRNLGLTNDGRFVYTTNTDGDTASDELVVLFDGLGFSTWFREGEAVPGFAGNVFGTTLNATGIRADGLPLVRATSTVGSLPSDQDDFLFNAGDLVAQEGVTTPTGEVEAWDLFDSNDFYANADGTSYLAQGDLTGDTTTDDVVVVDDAVVVREGSVIAGSGFASPVETILEPFMTSAGDWFARGDNDDQQDWVVRNGDVILATGSPITPGSTETFSDVPFSSTFFWMGGNGIGDWVVGGTTSNADEFADAVLVLNGETVLARQGDQVDVDGDGTLDDAFINVFNNDDGFLTDDRLLYFTATLVDGLGTDLGQAFLVLDANAAGICVGDIAPASGNGVVGFEDLLVLLTNYGNCSDPCVKGCEGDLDDDCDVDFTDLLALLANWGPCV